MILANIFLVLFGFFEEALGWRRFHCVPVHIRVPGPSDQCGLLPTLPPFFRLLVRWASHFCAALGAPVCVLGLLPEPFPAADLYDSFLHLSFFIIKSKTNNEVFDSKKNKMNIFLKNS